MDLKNVYKISDDRFSIEKIDNYDLIIEIHSTRFKFIVRENTSELIIWLEDHYLGNFESEELQVHQIYEILNNHLFLKANFWNSIKVLSDNPFFCFIPEAFFKPAFLSKYLKIQFPLIDILDFETAFEKVEDSNLVYGFPTKIIEIFREIFPNKEIEYSLSIINAIKYFQKDSFLQNKNIFILNDTWIDIVFKSMSSKTLKVEKLPSQSYRLKEILDCVEKDGQIKSLIYGEITPFSNIYKIIKQKLKALDFGTKPKGTKLSQYFDEMPDQRYFTLFANH